MTGGSQDAGAGKGSGAGGGQEHETPGTVTLVFLFLAWFVVMYVVEWKNRSHAWPLH